MICCVLGFRSWTENTVFPHMIVIFGVLVSSNISCCPYLLFASVTNYSVLLHNSYYFGIWLNMRVWCDFDDQKIWYTIKFSNRPSSIWRVVIMDRDIKTGIYKKKEFGRLWITYVRNVMTQNFGNVSIAHICPVGCSLHFIFSCCLGDNLPLNPTTKYLIYRYTKLSFFYIYFKLLHD